jgi:hypothetical protein
MKAKTHLGSLISGGTAPMATPSLSSPIPSQSSSQPATQKPRFTPFVGYAPQRKEETTKSASTPRESAPQAQRPRPVHVKTELKAGEVSFMGGGLGPPRPHGHQYSFSVKPNIFSDAPMPDAIESVTTDPLGPVPLPLMATSSGRATSTVSQLFFFSFFYQKKKNHFFTHINNKKKTIKNTTMGDLQFV